MKRWRKIIAGSLGNEKSVGSAVEIKVIGTFAFPRKKDVMETIIQLKYKKRTVEVGLLWLPDGKLWGMTTEPDSPFTLLMPIAQYVFTGYHLGSARTVRVSFSFNDSGSTAGLAIHTNKGDVIARKVEKDEENH